MRKVIPYSLLPLSLIACVLASAPWLRAFPSAVISVPLFGAAALSVLTPLIVVGIGVRRLWVSALIDLVLFVFYELLVTLREPAGFHSLYVGLVHGPSQILTFALPLVSPRTLLVAPVALCWLSGAIIGECVSRGWQSVLPYMTLLVTFGLSYAGTARAVTSSADGRRYDTVLAAALLVALLLLRAAQAWIAQDESAEMTQPDGILPLRGLAIGTVLSVVVGLAAAAAVQSSAFDGRPVTPARVPPLDQSRPLTPVSFVAGLRPADPTSTGDVLFKMSTDRATSNYVSIATVDYYDGDGWSFTRTFRPSGGVIPAETDPSMRAHGKPVTQQYTIGKGAMTTVPWMPYLSRAQRVTGKSVNVDSDSGMIVPANSLHAGDEYTVQSTVPDKNFTDLGKTALLGTSASQIDTTLANGLSVPLGTLITSLAQETGTPSDQPIPFLNAVAKDFQTKSTLAGGPPTSSASPSAPASKSGGRFRAPAQVRPAGRKAAPHPTAVRSTPHPTPSDSPTPTPSPSSTGHTGGTSFADVLASIRGSHAATPEQYATLMALIARRMGVPARVVAGFRLTPPNGSSMLPAGTYGVTTSEAWTWVEIPVRGLGWVVLDPSPGTYSRQTPPQTGGSTPSPTPSPTPSQNALLTQSNNGGHAVAPKSRTPHEKGVSTTSVLLIALIVLLAVIVVLVAVLLARKRVRARRRRRTGDPRRRLLGAWQESLDVLVESGLPDLTHLTSAEVAATTGERFGGEPAAQARYIGDAANVAIFSPTSWIGPAEADAVWRAQVVLTKSVRRRLGWRDRVGAGLRYNRGKRVEPRVGPSSWSAAAKARATANSRGRHARPRRGRQAAK
ncbi:MAG: hypothetical protein QOH89_3070 [Pseudonocardiales bacterium]|nr:hypothetical protein [Pseudonocardiales bacterium]